MQEDNEKQREEKQIKKIGWECPEQKKGVIAHQERPTLYRLFSRCSVHELIGKMGYLCLFVLEKRDLIKIKLSASLEFVNDRSSRIDKGVLSKIRK